MASTDTDSMAASTSAGAPTLKPAVKSHPLLLSNPIGSDIAALCATVQQQRITINELMAQNRLLLELLAQNQKLLSGALTTSTQKAASAVTSPRLRPLSFVPSPPPPPAKLLAPPSSITSVKLSTLTKAAPCMELHPEYSSSDEEESFNISSPQHSDDSKSLENSNSNADYLACIDFEDAEPCRDELHHSSNEEDSETYEPLTADSDSAEEAEESEYFAEDDAEW